LLFSFFATHQVLIQSGEMVAKITVAAVDCSDTAVQKYQNSMVSDHAGVGKAFGQKRQEYSIGGNDFRNALTESGIRTPLIFFNLCVIMERKSI
jgi:hypothetical protein